MQKSCAQCQATFEITEGDLAFLEKVSPVCSGKMELIPPPTRCPDCRQQRRWVTRNEQTLFKRRCDHTGKTMISVYPPDSPYVVFSQEAYRSDAWGALDAGRPFDFFRPFFDQFHELLLDVPRRGMQQDATNENCDFTTFGGGNKNCYMTAACMYCQDTFNSTRCVQTKDSADCFICMGGELLYECIYCIQCYHCAYCKDSVNCQDSLLLDHCHNCKHCIACKNLRNKEYYIYNKPVSPEEFEAFRQTLFTSGLEEEREKFNAWNLTLPCLYAHLTHAENVTGDYIDSAKNCHECFGMQMGVEDCRYCQFCGMQLRDTMDCVMAGLGDLFYESAGIGPAHRCAFTYFAEEVNEVYYSNDLVHCSFCFGCTGLKHKQYCIFNKQYAKEEYEELVLKIIEHMRDTGEYGEFFPVSIATFPYNITVAQEYFPLKKEEVLARGWTWQEEQETQPQHTDAADETTVRCPKTGKTFRIIKQEQELLTRMQFPLPIFHPHVRHRERMNQCNPHRLWSRTCDTCGKEIQTSYAPDRPEIVYCEECYLKEVY